MNPKEVEDAIDRAAIKADRRRSRAAVQTVAALLVFAYLLVLLRDWLDATG